MQRRILLLPIAASVPPVRAQLGKIFEKLIKPKSSDNRIIDGLKEALRIGAANAIDLTGRTDGFFANTLIRILMPEKLRALEKGMRVMGIGKQVDAFILAMNRSAEAAAPFARDIFVGAIREMTFEDARRLLTGGDTAATTYFQTKTTEKLTAAFRPVVAKTMAENDVGRHFQNVLGAARKLPLIKAESLDIESHVVAKSLDGLFLMIGNEERKIRKDPAARVTSILKEVFG